MKKGFSFLYICSHLEEISSICDRCALFTNGRIQKILEREELFNDPPVTYMTEYNDMVRYHTEKREGQQAAPVVFQWKGYGEDAACNFPLMCIKENAWPYRLWMPGEWRSYGRF